MDKYVNVNKMLEEYEHSIYDTTDLVEMLYYMPGADVEEVRHGKWIELPPFKNIYTCSLCGRWGEHHWNYCPNCGAKMDLECENESH